MIRSYAKFSTAAMMALATVSPSQVSWYRIIDRKLTVPTLRLVTRVLGLPLQTGGCRGPREIDSHHGHSIQGPYTILEDAEIEEL